MRDITFELIEAIFNISRRMKEDLSMDTGTTQLSALQFHTLMFLRHHPGSTMSQIADYFHIELPSATSLIAKMCQQQLVLRKESMADRRLVLLDLTSEGETVLLAAKRKHREKIEQHLNQLSDEEKLGLLQILHKLQNKIGMSDET